MTSTQRYFEPAADAEHLTGGEMRDRGDALLATECPRLMGGKSTASGAARMALTVDRQGRTTRATLQRTSGDTRVDELFGTLTAMLQFEPPTEMKGATVTVPADVGFACSPTAHVMTFMLVPPAPVKNPVSPPE